MTISIGTPVVCVSIKCMGVKQTMDRPPIVHGVISYVHPVRPWFMVEFQAGDTVLRECYMFQDIGHLVAIKGGKKNESENETVVADDTTRTAGGR